jgi:hypothetical protein
MRLVVVERVGLAGAGAFHGTPESAAIDLTAIREPAQKADMASEMFVPLPNDQENPFAPAFIQGAPKRHNCNKNKGKNIIMTKMDDFSKFFKELFGFAQIEEIHLPLLTDYRPGVHPPVPGPKMMAAHVGSDGDNNNDFHILPFMPGPVRGEGFPPPPPPGPEGVSVHFTFRYYHPTTRPGTS